MNGLCYFNIHNATFPGGEIRGQLSPGTGPIIFAYNLTNNHIVSVDASSPGILRTDVALTGLLAGERLEGIDFRPATGQLFALGILDGGPANDEGRLYTINTTTGVATLVGAGAFSTTLAEDASYGFDFNPTVDRIRIVNSSNDNLRANPNTGTLAGTDTSLTFTAPATGPLVAVAYDRNFAGATATTLFGIDAGSNRLVRQGGVDGVPSPNGGVVTSIGALGVTVSSNKVGFDIRPGTGAQQVTLAGTGFAPQVKNVFREFCPLKFPQTCNELGVGARNKIV